jgi:hypothetical protein
VSKERTSGRRKRGRTQLKEAERRAFSASVEGCDIALDQLADAAEMYGQGAANVGPIETGNTALLDEYKSAGNAVVKATREIKRRCLR